MKKIFALLAILVFASGALFAQCNCGTNATTNNWGPITVLVPLPIRSVKCGNQFDLCVGDSIAIRAMFSCGLGCNAKYKAILKKNNKVVVEQLYTTKEIFFPKRIYEAGNYDLTFIPTCGFQACRPCTFYIKVAPCL